MVTRHNPHPPLPLLASQNGSYTSVGGVVAGLREDEPEVIEVRVWNDTVANLTLMALGTSAPEILLAIVEIVGNGFQPGDLGPGTIVGSAAFNLLVITGICMVGVGCETRRVARIKVGWGVTLAGPLLGQPLRRSTLPVVPA